MNPTPPIEAFLLPTACFAPIDPAPTTNTATVTEIFFRPKNSPASRTPITPDTPINPRNVRQRHDGADQSSSFTRSSPDESQNHESDQRPNMHKGYKTVIAKLYAMNIQPKNDPMSDE